MKKISIYSLIIGIGIGIIITSIFNIVWFQLYDDNFYENKSTTDKILNENKDNINHIQYKNGENNLNIQNKDNNIESLEKENYSENQDYWEIFISKGMGSEEIGELLEDKGIIKSKQEFNHTAAKLNVTKKFQYGLKTIPKDSSINEIMIILTK